MGCFTLPLAINITLSVYRNVILEGKVLPEPKSFGYYFMTNDTNIPLVVNPRWKAYPGEDNDVIVINRMVNGTWGTETRVPFPDNFGYPRVFFAMTVSFTNTSFIVSVNGQTISNFPNIVGVDELKIFKVANVNSPDNQAICAETLKVV